MMTLPNSALLLSVLATFLAAVPVSRASSIFASRAEDAVNTVRGAASVVADTSPAIPAVRDADFGARDQLAADISTRLGADHRTFSRMETKEGANEASANFQVAMKDVEAREKTLRRSLKLAQAAGEVGWMAAREDLSIDYAAYAEAAAQARVLAAAGPMMASAVLDAGTTIDAVQATPFAQRARVTADIQAKLGASARAVMVLQVRAGGLHGRARRNFAQASGDIRTDQDQLKATLDATAVVDAPAWTETRARLAADYGSYAEAVARAEFAVASLGALAAAPAPTGRGPLIANARD